MNSQELFEQMKTLFTTFETEHNGTKKVNNPQATKSCGCGSSFSTGDDDISELNEGKGCSACKH